MYLLLRTLKVDILRSHKGRHRTFGVKKKKVDILQSCEAGKLRWAGGAQRPVLRHDEHNKDGCAQRGQKPLVTSELGGALQKPFNTLFYRPKKTKETAMKVLASLKQ